MRTLLVVFLAATTFLPLQAQHTDLETALFLLPGVTFQALDPPEGFAASYELRIQQPIDHEAPGKGTFLQRVFLNHRGTDHPTVLVTQGYAKTNNRPFELATYLDANEVNVEHRYFGASIPDSTDWQYLNLKQATADLHAIRTLFEDLYTAPWVSTGVSKGGMTTIAYRYFFPDDVAASVPYVAPLQDAREDERLYDFLHEAGTPACRAKHLAYQRRILQDREQALPRYQWYAKGKDWTFTYMSLEEALEYAVLEYPFSFWQYGHDCGTVPGEEASIDEALAHLDEVVGLRSYSDQSIAYFGPHFYQAATETGYYGFETEAFEDLLRAVPEAPHAAFVPKRFQPTYDPTLLIRMTEWVETEGKQFVFFYGALDTWTAAAVEPLDREHTLNFVMPGRHHGDARIKNLTTANRKRMHLALEAWLGIPLSTATWSGQ